MGLIILYLIGYSINATYGIYTTPDYISTHKVLIVNLFYPLHLLTFLINLILVLFGVHLQFSAGFILSKKEAKGMTDNLKGKFSDRSGVSEDFEEESDEK